MKKKHLRPPPAYPGMTIGLLGGTFDPPHDGHMHISEVALKRLGLDRLWWLVTPGNPLKDRSDMTKFKTRLKKARKFACHPRIDVTGFEAARGSAYTAQTLAFLVERYPAVRFIWVMGADNLAGFHKWHLWREIMCSMPIAVVDRPGYRFAALSGPAAQTFAHYRVEESDAAGLYRYRPPAWTMLTLPLSFLSSTELRRRKAKKKANKR